MTEGIKNIAQSMKAHRIYAACMTLRSIAAGMVVMLMLCLFPTDLAAQIKIGGNIYGGGNQANVDGSTSVTVRAGDIGRRHTDDVDPVESAKGKVFGGARMANVGGNTLVNIDGANATGYIVINQVYGGNDIAGHIGTAADVSEPVPSILTNAAADGVDDTWNTYVHLSTKTEEVDGKIKEAADAKKVYIGQLFAGGNGDYYYDASTSAGKTTHYIYHRESDLTPIATVVTDEGDIGFHEPELAKTYLDVQGGSIVYAYGGGNKATVTEKTVIHVANPSKVVNEIDVDSEGNEDADGTNLLTTARFKEMGINTGFSYPSSDEFQIGRFFGGNNKADMAIRPQWNLQRGLIRNLYSGGNMGRMIYEKGLFLEIKPEPTYANELVIDNVYGGCRMADVRPMKWNETAGEYQDVDQIIEDIPGYHFPMNLAARTLVAGGDINNVYGGNDVRGSVYFGNAVGIHTSIRGDVYGGGNGSYPYTDNPLRIGDDIYGDLYYTADGYSSSVTALNDIRPDAEQVSIYIKGTEGNPSIIGGSVYVGGNCATIETRPEHEGLSNYPLLELKLGSYAIAQNVYLGNNGENMVSESILEHYADESFSTLNLNDPSLFADYMNGVAMNRHPRLIAMDSKRGDGADYIPYSSSVGSLFYGGNRGSMTYAGPININLNIPIYIYDKVVGGCNNANVAKSMYNARYEGGILGTADEQTDGYAEDDGSIKDRVIMNISDIRVHPMRLNSTRTGLEWNTIESDGTYPRPALTTGAASDADKGRRLLGGNIYGGCCQSGHVNGNVVINLKGTIHDRHEIFDAFVGEEEGDDILYERTDYTITDRKSGVILNEQGMDPEGDALNVFGGGKGVETEIWGSATVNIQKGYTFQVFGGSENGAIGKGTWNELTGKYEYSTEADERYSTCVNLNCARAGVSRAEDSSEEMADVEFIYAGGLNGPIKGNTYLNLDNGRLFNAWGGSCNADIMGYADTRIGTNGFPYLRDHVYGANDLGGEIKGVGDFSSRVSDEAFPMVQATDTDGDGVKDVLKANAYVEYLQGRMVDILGGGYGDYDYLIDYPSAQGFSKPLCKSVFVNFRPANNGRNHVNKVFGGGQGRPGSREGDESIDRTYVLIDIADENDYYSNMEIFGSGSNDGLGMGVDQAIAFSPATADKASAIIDLIRGQVAHAYGGSYNEGVTRRTLVNVPDGSTIKIGNIFGGAYGTQAVLPCDVYESNVNYQSEAARVSGSIYGGNNSQRRTLYAKVKVSTPVWSNKESGYLATVYGAGNGADSWAEYTEVNLEDGARVYEVYGGGYAGKVFNVESCRKFDEMDVYGLGDRKPDAWSLGTSYNARTDNNLTNPLVLPAAEYDGGRYNANVRIKEGATVVNYAYGGGYGSDAVVAGTTYIALLGGEVVKDIYGSGTSGGVEDLLASRNFTASTNVYIEGGSVRNVYGGGWRGSVGHHTGTNVDPNSTVGDVLGESNVVIGRTDGDGFVYGIPSITRNVYGGGEGGGIWGTAYVTINNGYIGYRYKNIGTEDSPSYDYVAELDDKAPGDNLLDRGGNVFGGGYVANSYVDNTMVKMYGGVVRGSLHGGGEIGPVGRGTVAAGAPSTGIVTAGVAKIYKAGKTNVQLYDGWVKRDVFGGGRGYDNWGGEGYMTDEEKLTMDRSSKGYVFGQTEVNIYGGEVGTDEGVALGYGNVFGGGDIGYVYSAYQNGSGVLSKGEKSGARYDNSEEGYYYKHEGGAFVVVEGEKIPTEDCKVLVEPWCKANSSITINGRTFAAGEYVPTSYLNWLGNKNDAQWSILSEEDVNKEGIIIHNGVFAGGNTSPGSTIVHANTTTVYGNATASIHDVFHRDLITIGTGHTGGLYGDGNLTLVDGYRELNITNYGTDYYHINSEITLEQYKSLPIREAAYYEIRYKCVQGCKDKDGKNYAVGTTITADEMQTVFEGITVKVNGVDVPMVGPTGKPLESYWVENGVLSRYAGRIMNTIQRADFCGVYGSRMIMQGAQDRVPATVDYTNYTINRVREVSLNKKESLRADDKAIEPSSQDYYRKRIHGNYFGIYSVVNFLGALTSDVDFNVAKRTTDNEDTGRYQADADGIAYGTATFYDWKKAFNNKPERNNGNSHNKVALASGVYLELTTELSTGTGVNDKDWGYITGVVELDLINVQKGIGGGFVYAKNEHGVRSGTGQKQLTLTALNAGAITKKMFTYDPADATKKEWQTSGNFVHSTQTIIDDCYNRGGKYLTSQGAVPAHYWYIKGSVYIYDQYISAYTGTSNAYSETVNIPLTISAASHGRLTLLNVMPNYYAYYSVNSGSTQTPIGAGEELVLRDVSYKLNDPINYWDYTMLSETEKHLFVPRTYVVTSDCMLGETLYEEGTVLLPEQYNALKASAPTKKLEPGDATVTPYVHLVDKDKDADFDYAFRLSNNVGHDTGFILTYNINNPSVWDKWYTDAASSTHAKQQTEASGYVPGPTYRLKDGVGDGLLLGQRDYIIGNIIPKETEDIYQSVLSSHSEAITDPTNQATFKPAWIVTSDVVETTNISGTPQRLHKGAALAKEDYSSAEWSRISSSVAEAYVVTSSIQLTKTDFIYRDSYMTLAEKNKYKTDYPSLAEEIDRCVVPAYYCTEPGKYGGNYYQKNHNYRGLAAFTSMSESDRNMFEFNYDALDLLIDPTYSRAEGVKYQYDGKNFTTEADAMTNPAHYSLETPIDYQAVYKGSGKLHYKNDEGDDAEAEEGAELSRTEYESLANERRHYSPIKVTDPSIPCYVVKRTLVLGDSPYAAGQVMEKETYDDLSDDDKEQVAVLNFAAAGNYYYCREGYNIDASNYTDEDKGAVTSVNGVGVGTTYTASTSGGVPEGIVISEDNYENLVNNQINFVFHGLAPTETSTLYVTSNSDIKDLSTERIITVVYQYDYVESDMEGMHITPYSERHVLNIHLQFKSGVPTIEDIPTPEIVLPGTSISIREPFVTPGAYEVTGGGWELFDDETDAESHINGVDYVPNTDPLYLYQNKNYMAYYAKTYLGKTYSNHVPVSVANYHDLKKVMEAKEHHYYIDHREVIDVDHVEPKIYINDYSGDATGSTNGLDLLKSLYDLSVLTGYADEDHDGLIDAGTFAGHKPLNGRVAAGEHLQFFLRSDIDHSTSSWTPIAETTCFEGVVHGDGHTITGLDHSLFGKLCGDVYNLGVTGTFTSAGVVDSGSGYVENCWVKTTGTPAPGVKAVFGDPTASGGIKQVVNCYYPNSNAYAAGKAIQMPDKAFYDGEVAYNLNGFYLYKRYNDNANPSAASNYTYWLPGEDEPQTGSYAANEDLCSSGYNGQLYVEDRFADGDFRYAAGTIPAEADERLYVDPADEEQTPHFYPIWPDDYLFFGQRLTYGHVDGRPHQDNPSAVTRSSGRIDQSESGNRVYRAPAYYGNKTMSSAYFNPYAVFAKSKNGDASTIAYKGMTAIDFTGSNGDVDGGYLLGGTTKFYPPLLDDAGLVGFHNVDLTRNLLAYTAEPGASAAGITATTVREALYDPICEESAEGYRSIARQSVAGISGHWVQKVGEDFISSHDHLLVDRQDFNAPIAYTFDSDKRMWYQREPNLFVEPEWSNDPTPVRTTKGWESVSLPFTAELVTTNQKGEITHFYSGSEESKNETGVKIGHEYWLRELNNITASGDPEVYSASLIYPTSVVTDEAKVVTNSFLWDYYYQGEHEYYDYNHDEYHKNYYKPDRNGVVNSFVQYPLLTSAKPYIIGFPSETYYEFDLSGNFVAGTTSGSHPAPVRLENQCITFASKLGANIRVSDDELEEAKAAATKNGYTFVPTYAQQTIEAGTSNYTMSDDGDSYDKVAAVGDDIQVDAFRPYFSAAGGGGVKGYKGLARSIVFSKEASQMSPDEDDDISRTGKLYVLSKTGKIVVTSTLRNAKEVRIVSAAGITVTTFTIQPGETIETPIRMPGVYIVNNKKLSVK